MNLNRVKHSPKVDFSGWNLEGASAEEIADCISKELDKEANCSAPIIWADPELPGERHDGNGGPPVDDPLTVYIHLPLASEDDNPFWSFSIADLLLDELSEEMIGDRTWARSKVCAALRALADKIENRS